MPFGLSPWHLVAIAIVALVLFGAKRLPEIGRSLGKSFNEFRHGFSEMGDSFREGMTTPAPGAPSETLPTHTTCAQCGTENENDHLFCKKCGAKLSV